ncbi:MAG: MBL fold metallo-hydrolase [Thermodesulfobacteriota bacterium]
MRFCVLGSGSRGNATFVEAAGVRLLIDAGFSGREIERRLAGVGIAADSLSHLLVTHEHGDHIRGVGILSRRYRLPVYCNRATLAAAGDGLAGLHRVEAFETGVGFSLGGLACHPFAVSHDAAEPVGFLLDDGVASLGYCTDTGAVSRLMRHRLSGCGALILECNHDPELLKNGPYPPPLKQRVRSKSGHLANHESLAFLSELLHPGLRQVVLAHISETNNHHDAIGLALTAVFGGGADLPAIHLAGQDEASPLFSLAPPAAAGSSPR